MRDFKRLLIWQNGMQLVDEIYKAANRFPEEERFGMRSQITRAAISIPANIAEGSGKKSQKEYRYYVETALSSAFELETHLLIIQQRGWFPQEQLEQLIKKTTDVQRMMSRFIDKLT